MYFTPDFLAFFRELADNNNRPWFETQKPRYEASVKAPLEAFVTAVLERIAPFEETIQATAKDCIYRINRDVRFAKDKSPYKSNASFVASTLGRKFEGAHGLYVELSGDKVFIATGAYQPTTQQLYYIRKAIVEQSDVFHALLEAKDFKKNFVTLKGDENKKIPADFKEAYEREPLLIKKQYLCMVELPAESILSETFLDQVVTYYLASKPLDEFLIKAMSEAGDVPARGSK